MATATSTFRTSRPRTVQSVATPREGFDLLLNRIGDLCLIIAVVAVPLMMAGIRETGIAVFICCSLLMGLAWAVQQLLNPTSSSPLSGAEPILLLAVGLVVLQTVPLPSAWISVLSPFTTQYMPLWISGQATSLGGSEWSTISLTPSLTRSGMVLTIAYTIFFLTLVQRLKSTADIENTIRLIAISAAIMACVGLAQLFFGNGQFLWFIEHPSRNTTWPAKGTFTNQNHFAHFLALGMGPLIWWWQNPISKSVATRRSAARILQPEKSSLLEQQILGAVVAVVALAGFLTVSRGGIVAMGLAGLLSAGALLRHWRKLLKLVIPAIAFAVLGVLAVGTDQLEARWQALQRANSLSELSHGRFALWDALAKAIPYFLPAGSGLGSHAEVYPTWLQENFSVRFSHAENGYLQVLLELGLPGLILVIAAAGLCSWWIVQGRRRGTEQTRQRLTVLAASIIVSLLHSLVDFPWYIPACLIITLVIAACICRSYQLSVVGDQPRSSKTWPTVLTWILLLSFVPLGQLSATIAIRDARSEVDWLAYRKDHLTEQQKIDLLEQCILKDPTDSQARSRLAALYLNRFETTQTTAQNQMSVLEIRNTVRSVEFEDQKQLAEWLQRAFGESTSDLYRAAVAARKGVLGQPLRGETYLILAQLGFLTGMTEDEEKALLRQAVLLRPHSPVVLYRLGMSLAERGQIDAACQQMARAFSLEKSIRPAIAREFAPVLTASDFIDRMKPGADGLFCLFSEYEKADRPQEQTFVATWYAAHFRELVQNDQDKDPQFWMNSYRIFTFQKDQPQALYCLKQAVTESHQDFALTKLLALELLKSEDVDRSKKLLSWCQLRSPGDPEVEAALKQIKRMQVAGRNDAPR